MDITELPFEFCALRFLIQWEQSEKVLHEQIAGNPSLTQIRSALRYFQVARTFKGLKSDEAAQAVADAFREVAGRSQLSPEEKVSTLASQFQERFKQFNLSASSKLLWLKFKEPYVVYVSRAVRALKDMGCKLKDKSTYGKYCPPLARALPATGGRNQEGRLPEVKAFLPPWRRTEAELTQLAAQPWFLERVFDIYLWERGGEG